ncbi:hypothetical protein BDY19DRAFT_712096 [Irpex rosettiformis]|uniref:Uncharacterized protein n=1 Tax=Irpex rosettiformis TaxID=378272 RepID=A0ACB8U8J6_9APHY|nr:hypothetical protein BDY19DRAFT_712096 [Irpex rosettiformis]
MLSVTCETHSRSIFMGYPEPMWSNVKPTGISRLPQELIDLIVDNLSRDAIALRSCSFVCRAWLKQCRHHLFGLLRVRDTQVRTSLRSRPILQERFQAFLTFITTVASPGFCAKVHTLCLLGNEERLERQAPESFISAHMLAAILGQLPRVRILELNRVNFTPLPTEPRTPIILPLGKVKLDVLSIGRIGLEEHSPDGLFSVLGLFSTLGMLRVSYLETPRNVPTPAELTRLLERLQVHRFSLKGHSSMMPAPSRTMPYMLKVLLNSNSVHTLQSVEIKCCTMDQIQALGQLVRETESHLRSIAVDISDIAKGSNDFQGVVDMLGLRTCSGLRNLRLQVFPNEEDPASHLWLRASHFLVAILSSASPTLTTLTVVLQYHDVLLKNCMMADWESLRHIGGGLGWHRYTNLKAVVFALMPRCSDHSVEYEAKHHITVQMSDLARSGVLKFTTTVSCRFVPPPPPFLSFRLVD